MDHFEYNRKECFFQSAELEGSKPAGRGASPIKAMHDPAAATQYIPAAPHAASMPAAIGDLDLVPKKHRRKKVPRREPEPEPEPPALAPCQWVDDVGRRSGGAFTDEIRERGAREEAERNLVKDANDKYLRIHPPDPAKPKGRPVTKVAHLATKPPYRAKFPYLYALQALEQQQNHKHLYSPLHGGSSRSGSSQYLVWKT
ncbi:hypothetical protein B0T24DRAFT_722639 [Lasiosphaeria ovina]|uniref:Uncharacterized protein n=1 Tax=Lasiosphaeria ovina TaxID=92902 RepID=A0AAE0JYG5_9PEZI|nr:hypothetical protein B0T24DRAFT_722639 [Lasiosphaeria ovina]